MHKKMSPLKHVTPILKKYNCQRQAKNGKSMKLRAPGKELEKGSELAQPEVQPAVNELVSGSGMDSLDAALKKAEMCMSGNKESSEFVPESSVESVIEDTNEQLQDLEEDGISTTLQGSNHQTVSHARTQLRNRGRMLKRRNRLLKDLEHTLPLILPEHPFVSEEMCSDFALAFFNKAREHLEEAQFQELLVNMTEFGASFFSVTDLYHRAIVILKDRPDLCEEFLGFLLPHQALHCGKFMEHLGLVEMTSFLKRLEMNFSKQPQQLRKIHGSWARLAATTNVTLETVRNTILPLLKGNTFLADSFLQLLPSEKPPESKMTDFHVLSYEEMESEHSGDDEIYENIEVPPGSNDSYGGDRCQCCCHDMITDAESVNRSRHCVPCGLKFISGKVYVQTEHGLRPARVHFNGRESDSADKKRLNSVPRSRSRRGKTQGRQEDVKAIENDDEACFSNKSKSPRSQRPKMSKQGREKTVKSPNMSRSVGNRKPNVGKTNASPVPPSNDEEALPAADPTNDEKPHTLDFSDLSSVLKMEKQETKTSLHENNSLTHVESSDCDNIKRKVNSGENESKAADSDEQMEVCEDDSICDVDVSGLDDPSKESVETSWTREEDRIILQTFQAESDADKTLSKISSQLPNRSRDAISRRFQTLMSLIQQMR